MTLSFVLLGVVVSLLLDRVVGSCSSEPGCVCIVSQMGQYNTYSSGQRFLMVHGSSDCYLNLHILQLGNPFELHLPQNECYHVDDCVQVLPKAHTAASEHGVQMFVKEKQTDWFLTSDTVSFIDGIKKAVSSEKARTPTFGTPIPGARCQNTKGIIYIISPNDTDYFLIQGAADSTDLALDELQSGNPLELNVMAELSVMDCSASEQKAHSAAPRYASQQVIDGIQTNWYGTVNHDEFINGIKNALSGQQNRRSEL